MASGTFSTATATFRSEGDWTSQHYHRVGVSTYISYVTRSRGGTVEHFVGAAPASAPLHAETVASKGALQIVLRGKNAAGANAAAQYGAVAMARFAYTDEMVAAVADPAFGLPVEGFTKPPYVIVTGDCLVTDGVVANGAGEPGPLIARGAVTSFETLPVALGGAFRYNARKLKIRLVEK